MRRLLFISLFSAYLVFIATLDQYESWRWNKWDLDPFYFVQLQLLCHELTSMQNFQQGMLFPLLKIRGFVLKTWTINLPNNRMPKIFPLIAVQFSSPACSKLLSFRSVLEFMSWWFGDFDCMLFHLPVFCLLNMVTQNTNPFCLQAQICQGHFLSPPPKKLELLNKNRENTTWERNRTAFLLILFLEIHSERKICHSRVTVGRMTSASGQALFVFVH